MGPEFHVDRQKNGQTNRYDEANSRFCNFADVPRNQEAIWNVAGGLEERSVIVHTWRNT
jgi:hypothetical protein